MELQEHKPLMPATISFHCRTRLPFLPNHHIHKLPLLTQTKPIHLNLTQSSNESSNNHPTALPLNQSTPTPTFLRPTLYNPPLLKLSKPQQPTTTLGKFNPSTVPNQPMPLQYRPLHPLNLYGLTPRTSLFSPPRTITQKNAAASKAEATLIAR